MIQIGQYNTLSVFRKTSVGFYLGDEEGQEVLLPAKYAPPGLDRGQSLSVFVYKDSEDRLIATTLQPKITLNHFALLRVNMLSPVGAFLDWGLEKDLLVPFREQPERMEEGKSYLVYLYLDESTDRLVASGKLNRFLSNDGLTVQEGEEVEVLFWRPTNMGYTVIVNNRHKGLIYSSELYGPVPPGSVRTGYIAKIREGNKLDVQLRKPGYASIEPSAEKILEQLKKRKGFLPLTDNSPPEDIARLLDMSKKTFKKSVGLLYKQRLIRLEPDGIYLT